MAMKTQSPLLSLLILITVLGGAHATGYTPTPSVGVAAPPPFVVAGKQFPPQSFQCNNATSKCHGQELKCPKQCPQFKPADPNAKACFIDCNSPKCEAVCRKRKPNCEGIGAACYDPRFVGGDGIMFYFHGKTNHHFTLLSDSNLQINARFIGRRPQGRSRDNTWIQALGIMYGPHTFTVAANKVSQWKYDVDQLLFTYNNMPVFIDEGHLSSWTAPDSSLVVDRTAMCNSIMITLPHVVEISINVVPITKEDDRIHNYQIPSNDCFAHLEVQFRFFKLSDRVEGVLGQTYRPNFQNPVKRGVRMPVMGGEDKFMTSRLLSADCKNCIFNAPKISSAARALVLDPSSTMDCTSKMSKGQGVVCRR